LLHKRSTPPPNKCSARNTKSTAELQSRGVTASAPSQLALRAVVTVEGKNIFEKICNELQTKRTKWEPQLQQLKVG
jgi:hypothetical protein